MKFSFSFENELSLTDKKSKSDNHPQNPESYFHLTDTLISQKQIKRECGPSGCLFLVLQLIGQPIKTLIEAVAAGGAGGLDVPVAVTQGM